MQDYHQQAELPRDNRLWLQMNLGLEQRYQLEMHAVCSPIMDLVESAKSPCSIKFAEECFFIKREEALESYYPSRVHRAKLQELTTFYKFHQEVPRLFMAGKCTIIHQFYDCQRRMNYERVKRMLELDSEQSANTVSQGTPIS